MDELNAAAAVLAMAVDSESEEDLELGAAPDESGDHIGHRNVSELSSEDKEKHPGLPACGEAGAALDKVLTDP